jgi:heavy metal sensor kinase
MHRPRFYRSIRFRLTAWYTLLLAAILIGFAFAVGRLIERQLREDVDARLQQTSHVFDGSSITISLDEAGEVQVQQLPALDALSTPGQIVQIFNRRGEKIAQRGDFLGSELLPHSDLNGPETVPSFRTGEIDNVKVRTYTFPLVIDIPRRDPNADPSFLVGGGVVGESLEPLERTIRLMREIMLLASPIGLALAALGGWWLAGRSLKPVDKMTASASAIALGDATSTSLATRIDVPNTGDELARLAITYNQMLERLENAFSKQQRFVADASHELRTPLTAIRGNIDVLHRQASVGAIGSDELAESLEDLRRESARMGRLIQDLLTLARSDASSESEPKDQIRLDEVVDDAMKTASGLTSGQHLTINPLTEITIRANRDRMIELILILVENAIRHTPAGGEISVSLEREGGVARLIVQDTGEGIAPDHLPYVFERFFRADKSRDRASGGTGLGLAIARDISRQHGGDIAVESAPGAGATFTVRLPIRP